MKILKLFNLFSLNSGAVKPMVLLRKKLFFLKLQLLIKYDKRYND